MMFAVNPNALGVLTVLLVVFASIICALIFDTTRGKRWLHRRKMRNLEHFVIEEEVDFQGTRLFCIYGVYSDKERRYFGSAKSKAEAHATIENFIHRYKEPVVLQSHIVPIPAEVREDSKDGALSLPADSSGQLSSPPND